MVSKLLTFITGRLSPWIIESTHGLKQATKQARRPDFYKYIDYAIVSFHNINYKWGGFISND